MSLQYAVDHTGLTWPYYYRVPPYYHPQAEIDHDHPPAYEASEPLNMRGCTNGAVKNRSLLVGSIILSLRAFRGHIPYGTMRCSKPRIQS